jgi:predicted N-acetyltransferase YhbS
VTGEVVSEYHAGEWLLKEYPEGQNRVDKTTGCEESDEIEILEDGIVMRGVRDERDIGRFAALHGSGTNGVYGRMTVDWCRRWSITCENLLRYHPEVSREEFVFVEDERTGEVVSTSCLIPWRLNYEGVHLDVAMLEEIGTLPDYRHRGFVRAQMKRFHRNAEERGCAFTIIWGIPYFYRQYGYTYALDLQTADTIPVWQIPDARGSTKSAYEVREAGPDDAGVLDELYRRSRSTLRLFDMRSREYWQFLLRWMRYPVRLIIDKRTGAALGYFCVQKLEDKNGVKVFESAVFGYDAGMFVLQQLKSEAGNEIQLEWPETGELVKLGRSLGSTPLPVYQWLVRVSDIGALIQRIGPALVSRIEASVFKGLTCDICVNLFKNAVMLRFKNGKLVKVERAAFVDASIGADRRIEELVDAWPDITVRPESRHLMEVLFPRITSYLILPWQYYGPV